MTMNLTTDPWIPVIDTQGRVVCASLRQVFCEGHTLQDLAARPHERVALMRLLICIAQAALEGPADGEALEKCSKELPGAAERYLDRWRGCFGLFDTERPFLQLAGLSKPPKPANEKANRISHRGEGVDGGELGTVVSKMDLALATGEKVTLFDNAAAREEQRVFGAERLALTLIAFQCFSPGGTIGAAVWHGSQTPGTFPNGAIGSSSNAPCAPRSMLHSFVRMPTLAATVLANLLTKRTVVKDYRKPWGKPVWEFMPKSFSDRGAIENATDLYLGRLVPLSRGVLLRDDLPRCNSQTGFLTRRFRIFRRSRPPA